MNIKEMLAPTGSKCRCGRKLKGFVGVTIHNTGNAVKGANALSHARYLQGGGKDNFASWHYCVDENMITRSIPEDEVAWHAADGTGNGNMKTIAIEICMNSDGAIRKATDNAAELAADILKRHGIKKADNFLHQHNRWSGKNCPQMIRQGVPYDWQTFLTKVNAQLQDKPKHSDDYIKVQAKYGFDDSTMSYLQDYKYADALFLEMLESSNQQDYQINTINYISSYKYGKEVFAKLAKQ